MKNIRVFYLKIFSFFGVKFSIYLNRCVFVMYHFYTSIDAKIKLLDQLMYFNDVSINIVVDQ